MGSDCRKTRRAVTQSAMDRAVAGKPSRLALPQ